MKPMKFPEANLHLNVCEHHRKQGVVEMDVYHYIGDHDEEQVIECWEMTWKERFSALFFGKVWLYMMTSKKHVPPVALTATKTAFEK